MTKKKQPHELLSRGRPTLYRPELCELAFSLALLEGNDDKAIAKALLIDETTYYRWQDDYPDFRESIRAGKEPADAMVSKSLFKKATGYEYTRKVPKVLKTEFHDENGNKMGTREEVVFAEEVVIVPPDVGAGKMWLSNRRRGKWSETSKVEVTGADGAAIKIDMEIKFV